MCVVHVVALRWVREGLDYEVNCRLLIRNQKNCSFSDATQNLVFFCCEKEKKAETFWTMKTTARRKNRREAKGKRMTVGKETRDEFHRRCLPSTRNPSADVFASSRSFSTWPDWNVLIFSSLKRLSTTYREDDFDLPTQASWILSIPWPQYLLLVMTQAIPIVFFLSGNFHSHNLILCRLLVS